MLYIKISDTIYKQLKNGRVSQQWRIYLLSLVIIQWKRYCIIHLSLTTRIFFSVLDKIFIEKGCSFTNTFVTNIRTFLGKYYRIPVNKAHPHINPHNRINFFKKIASLMLSLIIPPLNQIKNRKISPLMLSLITPMLEKKLLNKARGIIHVNMVSVRQPLS